jgi:hypothetical protein
MIRPPKDTLEKENGTLHMTGTGGYRWYFLNKGDLSKEKKARRPTWTEDGGHHYFTCPYCFAINKAHTDGGWDSKLRVGTDIHLSFIHNGRDLDSFACEVCCKCSQHLWITFTGAVPRKIWGALKIDKTKCPKCRKVVKDFQQVDSHFDNGKGTLCRMFLCCGMRWR